MHTNIHPCRHTYHFWAKFPNSYHSKSALCTLIFTCTVFHGRLIWQLGIKMEMDENNNMDEECQINAQPWKWPHAATATLLWGDWAQAAPNSLWVPAWDTTYSYFCVLSHLCLSSGGPLVPDVLLADGVEWHRKSPLPSLWGWQWHGRTFRGDHTVLPALVGSLPPQVLLQGGRNQRASLNASVLAWWKKGIAPLEAEHFPAGNRTVPHFTRKYMEKMGVGGEGWDTQVIPAEVPSSIKKKTPLFYGDNYQSLGQHPQGQDEVPINGGFQHAIGQGER